MKLYHGTHGDIDFYFLMNYTDVVAFDERIYRSRSIEDLIKLTRNYTTIDYIDNYFYRTLLSEPDTVCLAEFKTVDEFHTLKQTHPEWFI